MANLKSFVQDLLVFDPHARLVSSKGSSGIHCSLHTFFDGLDWDALELGHYSAMYIPFNKAPLFRGNTDASAIKGKTLDGALGSQWSHSTCTSGSIKTTKVVDESPTFTGDQNIFSAF